MKNRGIMMDRKSPETAIAQIVTILNNINTELNKTGVTLVDFIKLTMSDITAMAGTFSSDTFEEDYRMYLTDFIYPVGTYYETSLSEEEFNPNGLWAGTWVLEKDEEDIGGGLVHISADDTYELGSTGGEAEHTLTVDEIPSHRHSMADRWSEGTGSETAYKRDTNRDRKTIYTEYEGGDGAHNNMQPYIAVNRWHRTA